MTTVTATSIIDLAIERHAAEAEKKRREQERADWRHFCGNLLYFFGHGCHHLPDDDDALMRHLHKTGVPVPRPYQTNADYLDATLMAHNDGTGRLLIEIDDDQYHAETLIELGALVLRRREDSEYAR